MFLFDDNLLYAALPSILTWIVYLLINPSLRIHGEIVSDEEAVQSLYDHYRRVRAEEDSLVGPILAQRGGRSGDCSKD